MLHGRVIGLLSQCAGAIDEGLLALNFLIDLADELVVVHFCEYERCFGGPRKRLRILSLAVCQLPDILVVQTSASDRTEQVKAKDALIVLELRSTTEGYRSGHQFVKCELLMSRLMVFGACAVMLKSEAEYRSSP